MVRCSITIDNYEHSRKRLYTSDINVPQGFNPKSVKAYCKFFVYNAQIVFFTTTSANLAIWLANLPSSIRVHTMLLASMCRAMPFFALWKKKHIFFDVDIVVKKDKSKCGLSWSVLFSTTTTYSAYWASLQKFLKGKSDAYKLLIRIMVFKSESVFSIVNKSWQRFLSLSLILWQKPNRMWFSVVCLINWRRFFMRLSC